MKPRKRASLSGLVVVELVSGRRVIVSPDDLPRLGALPPIASVGLAFESVLLLNDALPARSVRQISTPGLSSHQSRKRQAGGKRAIRQTATCRT